MALGALALSAGNTVYNVRQARSAPIEDRQRALRERLRTLLREVQTECSAALKIIEDGCAPASGIPPVFDAVNDRLDALVQEGLSSPGRSHIREIKDAYSFLKMDWDSLEYAEGRLAQDIKYGDDQTENNRRKTAALVRLQKLLTSALETSTKYIQIVSRIDDDPRKAGTEYRY